MNREIEIAYIIDDVDGVIERLLSNGFKRAGMEDQQNVYMTHPFFPHMFDDRKYLRFRYCSNEMLGTKWGEVSFSSPVVETVDGNAIEVRKSFGINHVFSQKGMQEQQDFLREMGFAKTLILLKKRQYFTMEGGLDVTKIHVEIDTGIEVRDAKGSVVSLEPTIQFCIEDRDDVDKEILKRMVNAAARDSGIQRDRSTSKNYFDRYFDIVNPETGDQPSMSIENHSVKRGEKVVEIRDRNGLVATVVPRHGEISIVSSRMHAVINDPGQPPKIVIRIKDGMDREDTKT